MPQSSANTVYRLKSYEPAQALALDADGLTFLKEVIYEGDFVADGQEFSVDKKLMNHWVEQFERMKAAGVKVPVPLRHTTSPTARRGTVLNLATGVNANKKNALFATIKFVDADAAKLARSTDVSLFVPKDFEDGVGNKYTYPVEHVALTDYPVIPGLEEFKPIVASFKGGYDMSPLKALAEKLGIQGLSDTATDEEIAGKIVELFTKLGGSEDTTQGGGGEDTIQASQQGDTLQGAGGREADVTVKFKGEVPPAFAASHKRLLRENRETKIKSLIGPHISKACADELVKEWCSDETLALALSRNNEDARFDRMIDTMKKNVGVSNRERTGGQAMRLGRDGDGASGTGGKSRLEADAERRAQEAKAG